MLNFIARHARSAFRRLPIVAMIAIVGTLIALAVPVVRKIKESSNAITNGNNLHQMGLQIHSFQDAYDSVPPAFEGLEKSYVAVQGGWLGPQGDFGGRDTESDAGGGEGRVERKIKTTAEIHVIANDFEKAEQGLRVLIKSLGGYTARADIAGAAGSPRSGRWRVRMPVERVESFLDGTRRLGVPQTTGLESEDVTAQFVDLEARLKNKTMQETTLRTYLTDKKAKSELKDILAVEQELARVRGEIEQMEGQRRLLNNLTSLATISVVIQEVKNYVPPETPTFASTIKRTFVESIDLLVTFAKQVVIAVVAAAPWLFVIAGGVISGWFIVSRRHVRPAAPQTPA
jgi:hypothetical protein